ncbi:MAG: DUF763 domain-containing protein [Actinomycetota bacterium]|nr:DUF763 domain-containing protein [Actinomycetota bacterium]
MHRTGTAYLPLHGGKAPRWLFERMKLLAGGILEYMVEELGPSETLYRFSNPFWFQSLGCVLGFDWHSSGVTTTTCGAVKEALILRGDLGIYAAGGKGAVSRRTPQEIEEQAERLGMGDTASLLVRASRMSAKVDNNALQDGYQIYHHFFLFTPRGEWVVVQQGMNDSTAYARRYHWLSRDLRNFTEEPHAAICTQARGLTLDMVARGSRETREALGPISAERPDRLVAELERLRNLELPRRHQLFLEHLHPASIKRVLLKTYERQPEDFATLLGMPGVGGKTLRALALIAELVHGTALSWKDPARYSFAHGGKDGYPYPVNRDTYDGSIEILEKAVRSLKAGRNEKAQALRRLSAMVDTPIDNRI